MEVRCSADVVCRGLTILYNAMRYDAQSRSRSRCVLLLLSFPLCWSVGHGEARNRLGYHPLPSLLVVPYGTDRTGTFLFLSRLSEGRRAGLGWAGFGCAAAAVVVLPGWQLAVSVPVTSERQSRKS